MKTVDPKKPWSHPNAEYLDSLTMAALLGKYSWTASESLSYDLIVLVVSMRHIYQPMNQFSDINTTMNGFPYSFSHSKLD